MESQTKKLLTFFLLPLALLTMVVWVAQFETRSDWRLHVNFYNVDSGDATLIKTPSGISAVIDGGSTDKILSKLGSDLPFFDHRIDLLVLTYPENREVTGLVDILKRFEVKKVVLPASSFSSGAFQEFLQLVADQHIQKIFARSGQRVWLDKSTVLDIFYPTEISDGGMVMKLTFGHAHVLFMDEASPALQQTLVSQFDLSSQILKLDDHVATAKLGDDFLQAVKPVFTITSPGQTKDEKFSSDGSGVYKN